MSSTTGPPHPLGTAAHLPPGGLIAIAWSCVVLAGAFGMSILFPLSERLRPIVNHPSSSENPFGRNRLLIPSRTVSMLGILPSRSNTDSEIIIVVARTLIRIVKAEGLGYDDYWIYLAYLILCINALLQTVQTPYIYHLVRVRAGLEPAGEGFLKDGNAYLRYEFAIIGLFWSVLWSVSEHFGAKSRWSKALLHVARHVLRAVGGFEHPNLSYNLAT